MVYEHSCHSVAIESVAGPASLTLDPTYVYQAPVESCKTCTLRVHGKLRRSTTMMILNKGLSAQHSVSLQPHKYKSPRQYPFDDSKCASSELHRFVNARKISTGSQNREEIRGKVSSYLSGENGFVVTFNSRGHTAQRYVLNFKACGKVLVSWMTM